MSGRAMLSREGAIAPRASAAPPVVLSRGAFRSVTPPASLPASARQPAVLRREAAEGRETEERVWGFRVTPAMCRCRREVAQGTTDARMIAAAYRRCDAPPANRTANTLERCVRDAVIGEARAQSPGGTVAVVVAGSTGLFGPIRCAPQPPGPCGAISARACRVHETFHDRQRRALAAQIGRASRDPARGDAFSAAYRRALDETDEEAASARIRRDYPEEYRALLLGWNDASMLARSEVEAFTRQHQFLADVGRALGRICP